MAISDYLLLLKRFLLAFLFFTLSRAGFYFYNFGYFDAAPLGETVYAFLYGLRFDLSTALIANLFFILASIIPYRSRMYEAFLKILFVVSNTLYLALIIGDYEFFAFNGKKLTYDLFLMGNDIQDQAFQLIFNYWYLVVLIGLSGFGLWKLYPSLQPITYKLRWYKAIAMSLFVFVLTGIGVRGGLQLRSISPKEAFVFKTYELGNLALNSAYSLVRSFGNEGARKVSFFKSDKGASDVIRAQRAFDMNPWGVEKQNVVVIIVESLAQEYLEKGYAPFIKKLAEKGLYFSNNFANGRRSMEALPSIMTGFPSIIGAPLYQTQYQSNKFHPLPRVLKKHGYKTAFFHGGKRGTMDFDAYCYSIGFDEYHALEDYPNQEDFDGHWGVYDHKYLSYFADKLVEYPNPFFAGVFTLSSHQPYSIPEEFKGKFPKGTLPIHESIGYADFSLEKFFEKAKTKPWFKDTLFIVTADHTQKLETKKFQSVLGRYRVPLIFYHPGEDLKSRSDRVITQHVDILPSVLDFLNLEQNKKLLYGSSVFGENEGRMINRSGSTYFLLKDRKLASFDGENKKIYQVGENYVDVKASEDSEDELFRELKAYIQYTNNGLRNNSIYSLDP